MNSRSCQTVRTAEFNTFFLLLETFLIEVCEVALCDTSWLAIWLHLRAQNHPTAQEDRRNSNTEQVPRTHCSIFVDAIIW